VLLMNNVGDDRLLNDDRVDATLARSFRHLARVLGCESTPLVLRNSKIS
jgi:hypothetical protein